VCVPFDLPADLQRATTLFEREYHTLSQLAHPNIISVFEHGVDAEGPFYTMERLTGQSLRACAPLPWREACRLIRDVASALAIVHSRRLVHRDVTPLNIYRSMDGTAEADRLRRDDPGRHRQRDHRHAALHRAGVPAACLNFALSRRQAYPAYSLAALREIWQTPPQRLLSLVPEIPEALEMFVAALLNLTATSRPPTAADVYERLTGIADLPRTGHGQVGRAYVTRTALIGREPELAKLRTRAERARAGHGQAILIKSPAGMRRSRLLDAAILQAKLSGLRVARADASDAQSAGLGAVARLLQNFAGEGLAVTDALRRHGLE
jgi:hypothetical protein